MSAGLLFVVSEPGTVAEAEFHDWYDHEHGPARIALDGIHSGERYRAADGERPSWLALYDVDLEVLETPQYRALREQRSEREAALMAALATVDRRIYRALTDDGRAAEPAALLVATALTVEPAAEEELAAWYAEEHVPMLHSIPGWLRTRRFALVEGDGPRHLALHALAGPEPLETAAYRAATSTPRRERLMRSVHARERRVWAHHGGFAI
jgi:hypothetical protein